METLQLPQEWSVTIPAEHLGLADITVETASQPRNTRSENVVSCMLLQMRAVARITASPIVETLPCVGGVSITLLKVTFVACLSVRLIARQCLGSDVSSGNARCAVERPPRNLPSGSGESSPAGPAQRTAGCRVTTRALHVQALLRSQDAHVHRT